MRFPRPPLPPLVPLIDTREQLPYSLPGALFVTLGEGDYSVLGADHVVRVERKTLTDYLACVGRERERFERELHRLRSYPLAFLLLEFTLTELAAGRYSAAVHPRAAVMSAIAWGVDFGVRVVWAGDRAHAQAWTLRTLERVHLREWRRRLAGEAQKEPATPTGNATVTG